MIQCTIAYINSLTGTLPDTAFYTTDLGKEGIWNYDPSDISSLDNYGTILLTADITSPKRIKRLIDGPINVKWFDKGISNNIYDDEIYINEAIAYLNDNGGGVLAFPSGIYEIGDTIQMYSYISLIGNYGEAAVSPLAEAGTKIEWHGGSNGTMLSFFNCRLASLKGFYLDGGGATDVTAILLDSDNSPSGSQNEFSSFSIRECYIGVQWGTTGIAPACANDGTRFSTFTIWSSVSNSKGFVINSGNAGQMSTVESGGIQVQDLGVDLIIGNLIQFRRVFGGGVMASGFFRISIGIDILIEGCSSECWGPTGNWRSNAAYFMKVVAPVDPEFPMMEVSITMIQNQINNPILVTYPVRIVSTGDAWGYCYDVISAPPPPPPDLPPSIAVTGTFTTGQSRVLALNNGTNPESIDLVTNELAHGWIDSQYVSLTIMDPGQGWIPPAYDSANFSASGAMVWTVQNTDVETYCYTLINRTMTVSFKLNATTVSGTMGYLLKIKIPNGKIAKRGMINMVRLDDNGVPTPAYCYVSANDSYIDIQPCSLSLFTPSTNGTTVQGQITFEII